MGEKELLEFYRKKFEEIHKDDDTFRKKLDKYLRNLISDRHDIEADSLRKSEKISDLQKALVDLQLSCFEERERFLRVSAENEQLKRNEDKLHQNVRQLLDATKEKDLRDRIIYILDDPKVEVGYRHKSRSGTSSPGISKKSSSHELLKNQLHKLQIDLDEHSKICQSKSDVIIEDCKSALEKAREKLIQNENAISELQNRLQKAENELQQYKEKSDDVFADEEIRNVQSELSLTKKTRSGTNVSYQTQDKDSVDRKASPSYLQSDHLASLTKNSRSDTKLSTQSTYQNVEKGSTEPKESTSQKESKTQSRSLLNMIEDIYNKDLPLTNTYSSAKDMHFTLIMLSKSIDNVLSLLQTVQSSQVFVQAAKIKSKGSSQKYVGETDIMKLQNAIRQCTRLSFDTSNLWKTLNKKLSSKESSQANELNEEVKKLDSNIEELAVATAEADLLTISLSRATFFDYLTSPKDSFTKFGVKEMNNHTKYTADVFKIERNIKSAKDYVGKAVKFTEWVMKDGQCSKEKKQADQQNKVESSQHQELKSTKGSSSNIIDVALNTEKASKSSTNLKSSISSNILNNISNKIQQSKDDKSIKDSSKEKVQRDTEDLTRQINKTLSKIKQVESGEYFKDNEYYKHLGEQITMLTRKLQELHDEFNVNSLQDQFNEYSSLTLSKLETIAKQSHDAVIAAEAQISAHRSNARNLSQKLRDTEDLLRESIHECLELKQKLHQKTINHEKEKASFEEDLKERLKSVSDFDDLDKAVKEVTSGIKIDRSSKSPSGSSECMFCKAGSGHKLCEEKIKELRSDNRKLTTELKLLKQDMKEEKKLSKMSQEQVNQVIQESSHQSLSLKNNLQSLESRNSSLLEQLKIEKNRLRNMERFRRLEIEGFQTDVKSLKNKILDLEKQLMKALLIFEHDKKDLELLRAVHTTAQNSKQAVVSIKRLKAKLYELETDIKHL